MTFWYRSLSAIFFPLPSAPKPDKRGTWAPGSFARHTTPPLLVTTPTAKICTRTVGAVLQTSTARRAPWGKEKQTKKPSSCISLKGDSTQTPGLCCTIAYERVKNCPLIKELKINRKHRGKTAKIGNRALVNFNAVLPFSLAYRAVSSRPCLRRGIYRFGDKAIEARQPFTAPDITVSWHWRCLCPASAQPQLSQEGSHI